MIIILGSVFWLTAYSCSTSEERNMNYGISLSTDKRSYNIDEPIIVNLKIFNYAEEEVTFHFNSSQRYDFIIEDEKGEEIWRWSEDKMFAMVLGEETIGPTNPELIYTEKFTNKLACGYYKITGVFTVQDRPISANVMILIK